MRKCVPFLIIFCIQIKPGKERANIAKLKDSDISGDDLKEGYIIKIGKITRSKSRGW